MCICVYVYVCRDNLLFAGVECMQMYLQEGLLESFQYRQSKIIHSVKFTD